MNQFRHSGTVRCLKPARIVHDALELPLSEGDEHSIVVTYQVTTSYIMADRWTLEGRDSADRIQRYAEPGWRGSGSTEVDVTFD